MNESNKRLLIVLLVFVVLVGTFVMVLPSGNNAGMASKGVSSAEGQGSTAIGTAIVKFNPSGGR